MINQVVTESIGDYLKAIYKLQIKSEVSINDISYSLKVAPSSVTKMVKKLVDLGLANHISHKNVTLTDIGMNETLKVIRKHRLLELFLVDFMNYSWDEVHDEACKLEHHISDKFEDTMYEMLNKPNFDPHGDPIPSKDGYLPEIKENQLSDLAIDDVFKINYIVDEKPDFLRFIKSIGLLPHTVMTVIDKQEFEGPLKLRFESGDKIGKIVHLGYESGKNIYVSTIDANPNKGAN